MSRQRTVYLVNRENTVDHDNVLLLRLLLLSVNSVLLCVLMCLGTSYSCIYVLLIITFYCLDTVSCCDCLLQIKDAYN